MRPLEPDDFVGQEHLMGLGKPFRQMLEKKIIRSCIFWGPPGVGKTTLAFLVAAFLNRKLFALSAINAGVKDVRETLVAAAKKDLFHPETPILFIDEIHRFNKGQQDALLEAVERGTVVLIGATTENPSFEINHALLSRCQVFVLESLNATQLRYLVDLALEKDEWLSAKLVSVVEYDALIYYSGGDARKIYNILEMVVNGAGQTSSLVIDNALVEQIMTTQTTFPYDKTGDFHYDIISAFIKSLRGSDPNAALFWMARMLIGGEDPVFITRRMCIMAAEDIGLANPNALLMAQSTMDLVRNIGMPECRIVMAQCAIYLATSPKSNSVYLAIEKAFEEAKKNAHLNVPLHLRNAPTNLMKELNYGKDYQYAHQYENNFVEMNYLPDELASILLYTPGNNLNEAKILKFLQDRWLDKY